MKWSQTQIQHSINNQVLASTLVKRCFPQKPQGSLGHVKRYQNPLLEFEALGISYIHAIIYLKTMDRIEIAIVGGGIGGLAMACALIRRGFRCRVFEKDAAFNSRKQGFGLTMQQGTTALKNLGEHIDLGIRWLTFTFPSRISTHAEYFMLITLQAHSPAPVFLFIYIFVKM